MYNPSKPESLGEHFTRNNYVFGKKGFKQDFTKVLYGTIHGTDAPQIIEARNRTLASMHDANVDNTVSGYVKPDNNGDVDLESVNNPVDLGKRQTKVVKEGSESLIKTTNTKDSKKK
jgi:hypothetical protein